jgi:hypothetical protein
MRAIRLFIAEDARARGTFSGAHDRQGPPAAEQNQVRSANKQAADFYARLGYLRDDVISFGKRLDPD